MSYKLRAAIALAVTGIANAAMAADDVYRLDDVVVTASRTAQTVDQALAPVTVITREEIERSQATSVQELVRRAPGIQVSGNGGPGSVTSIFIRGATSQQTLVLVDGQRVNSATGGTAELQYLDPDQIERIEIVRGPVSSLYGADAVGGVIHVFTRQGRGKPHVSIKAGVGNMGTSEFGVSAGGQFGATRFYVGASFHETEGFDVTNDHYRDFMGNSNNHGANLDKDGYRNKSLSASVSHQFANESEAGLRFSHAEGKTEFDAVTLNNNAPYDAYTLFNNTSLNGYYSLPVTDAWLTRVDLGYVDNKSKQRGDKVPDEGIFTPSFFATKRLSALWQNDLAWTDSQLLTVGLDYYQDKVDNSTKYINPETGKVEDSRYNGAIFVQNQSQFDGSDLQVSLRRDKNQSYGYHTTGNIAYGYDLPKAMRFIASYGTAFRAPTFNDLYFPNPDMPGNPDLKPEQSRNIEFILKGDHAMGHWQASVFQNDIEDMIEWAFEGGKFSPSNVDEARIRGVELSLDTQYMDWNIHTAVTFLDPEDTKLNKTLQRRAKQYMLIDADRQFGKWYLGGTLHAQGHSYSNKEEQDRLAGFATVDLRIARQINKEIKAELKLTNLLDKEYHVVKEYNTQPRAGIFSVTWTPEI